MEAVKFGPKVV